MKIRDRIAKILSIFLEYVKRILQLPDKGKRHEEESRCAARLA